jgi:hypothetical protein
MLTTSSNHFTERERSAGTSHSHGATTEAMPASPAFHRALSPRLHVTGGSRRDGGGITIDYYCIFLDLVAHAAASPSGCPASSITPLLHEFWQEDMWRRRDWAPTASENNWRTGTGHAYMPCSKSTARNWGRRSRSWLPFTYVFD